MPTYGEGKYIEFLYNLKPNSNNVDFNINLNGLNQVIQNNTYHFELGNYLIGAGKISLKMSSVILHHIINMLTETPDHLGVDKDDKEELNRR